MIANRWHFLFLLNSMVMLSSTPAFSEIRVGYSSMTTSSRQVSIEHSRKKRIVDQYSITGKNVIPKNKKNKFNRNTIWKILDKDKKFTLTVIDDNPRSDFSTTETSSEIVQSSRRETVSTNISGFESTRTKTALSPFLKRSLPPIVPVSTSVFNF